MSFVHHEPDWRVVPCLGCDEPIDERDLVRSNHWWTSCCLAHPYHFWCVRNGPASPHVATRCADCKLPLDAAGVRAAIAWGATFPVRVHRRSITVIPATGAVREHGDADVPRPPGIRLVFVAREPARRVQPTLVSDDAFAEQLVCSRFELVHDECPDREPCGHGWLDQLRAAPGDDDLRAVYADWLEQAGELRRARFVRLAIERRASIGEAVWVLGQRLRELRQRLPGSWCRDVCRTG